MINKHNELVITWCIEDVHYQAQEMGVPKLTDAEALEVLRGCDDCHDANYGISWANLEYHINTILEDRQKENQTNVYPQK